MWTTSLKHSQRGVLLIGAIFLLVVLGALGAFVLTIGGSQQVGHARDMEGARALSAARTGLEWGMYQVVNGANYCDSGAVVSQTLSNIPGFPGLAIQVDCESQLWNELKNDAATYHQYRTYTLTSTACNSNTCPSATPSDLYVERRLQATMIR